MGIRVIAAIAVLNALAMEASWAAKRMSPRAMLAAGARDGFVADPQGWLWTWGRNLYGEAGNGTTSRVFPPQLNMPSGYGLISIDIKDEHAIAIGAQGALYAWGTNATGQLGDGTTNPSSTPKIVDGGEWVCACAGSWHSAGIKSDGTLWTWGENQSGQLGLGDNSRRYTPTQVWHPSNPPLVNNAWKSVACGKNTTLAIKVDGSLWAWGNDGYGQLGDGGGSTNRNIPTRVGTSIDWASAAIRSDHALALKANGALYAWGRNHMGQLGLGNTTDQYAPIRVGSSNEWVAISAGEESSYALRANGSLWSWGNNTWGQLGNGTTTSRATPGSVSSSSNNWVAVSAGAQWAMAMRADGTVLSWGIFGLNDVQGTILGRTTTLAGSRSPGNVEITGKAGQGALAGGYWHSGMIKSDGTLWTFGNGFYGELGLNDFDRTTSPEKVVSTSPASPGNQWSQFQGGTAHSVALQADGRLWTTGTNDVGQLGRTGGTTTRFNMVGSDQTWTQVRSGGAHVLALRSNGTLWAWGSNNRGQLGDNTNTNRFSPVSIPAPTASAPRYWVAISAGQDHSAGILSDGSLWTWGNGEYGKLGLGSTSNKRVPNAVNLTNEGPYRWVAVECGYMHTVALRADGSLWAWGHNGFGEVGRGYIGGEQITPLRIGTDRRWVQISVGHGSIHSVAVDGQGLAWGWGSNANYDLGDGTTTDRPSPTGLYLPVVRSIHSVGYAHNFAMAGRDIFVWGRNEEGQLGLGNQLPGTTPVWLSGID